ncbi:unnamed protein product, partial [Sphacelaria rigidula]
YAPLSVRLVQACVRPGWVQAGETLKLLPGPCVEVTQDPDSPPEDLPTARELLSDGSRNISGRVSPKQINCVGGGGGRAFSFVACL